LVLSVTEEIYLFFVTAFSIAILSSAVFFHNIIISLHDLYKHLLIYVSRIQEKKAAS